MLRRISFTVLISFLLSFLSLTVFLEYSTAYDEIQTWKDEFYSRDFSNEKKILLIGSSQVGILNATYIDNFLGEKNVDYKVYNLGLDANRPQNVISSLDEIMSIDPDLIIYGLGFRDFENKHVQQFDKPRSSLPDPQESIKHLLILYFPSVFDFEIYNAPNVATLKFVRSATIKSPDFSKGYFESNRPFYHPPKTHSHPIASPEELKYEVELTSWKGLSPYDTNIDVIALKKIIQTLQDNDIQISLFTTPHNYIYLDATPEYYHDFLEKVTKELSSEFSISTYSLHDKYPDNTIWYDFLHITIYSDVINLYNDDIAEIIISELDE